MSIVIFYSDIHPNFIVTIKFITVFATLISAYTIYLSIDNQQFTIVNTGLNYFNVVFNNINTLTLNYFKDNKKMIYYYNELFLGISDYKESDRDIFSERLYTFQLLSHLDSVINYIDSYKVMNQNNFQVKVTEDKLVLMLKMFFKSKIFVEHWNEFKNNFALDWTKKYVIMATKY